VKWPRRFFDHDIAAFKSEIKELEAEAAHATGAATVKLETQLVTAKGNLDAAVHRAKQRVGAPLPVPCALCPVPWRPTKPNGLALERAKPLVCDFEKMVGAAGFELATLWSQTRCATRLRYAPTSL
jgi:hypothetical protein